MSINACKCRVNVCVHLILGFVLNLIVILLHSLVRCHGCRKNLCLVRINFRDPFQEELDYMRNL
jgi:hypothetical protein